MHGLPQRKCRHCRLFKRVAYNKMEKSSQKPVSNMESLVAHWKTVMVPHQRKKRAREDEYIRPKTRVFEPVISIDSAPHQTLSEPSTLHNS